jgi:hypothetical protein
MSATVIRLPERRYRPNLPKVFALLDEAKGDHDELFATAVAGLAAAQKCRERGNSPAECQRITDALALSMLALAAILGIPRGSAADGMPDV